MKGCVQFVKKKCIEDECHFVMNCLLCDDLREVLCQHYCEKIDGFNHLSADKMLNQIIKIGDRYTIKQVFKLYTRRRLCMFVYPSMILFYIL